MKKFTGGHGFTGQLSARPARQPQVKGTIKEGVGKITNDRNLKAEGKAEKKAGKVQQRIGHAKEAVVKLKEQLADLKTGQTIQDGVRQSIEFFQQAGRVPGGVPAGRVDRRS